MADIHKVGLLALREGRMLLCRKKRGQQFLILPGGKIEDHESDLECLHRELKEELGNVTVTNIEFTGSYTDVAAHIDGPEKTVHIQLYRAVIQGEPVASSEIGELVWFAPTDDAGDLAPSLRNQIVPDLVARGLL